MRRLQLSCWVCLVALVVPAHAGGGARTVRNHRPQQTVSRPAVTFPIYFPRIIANGGVTRPQRTGDPETLLREFLDLHTSMAYEEAAEVASRIRTLQPGSAEAHYNMACVLARLCEVDEALAALDAAVDHGWTNARHVALDPDLELVRRHRDYRRVARRLSVPTTPGVNRRSTSPAGKSRLTVALIHEGRIVAQFGSTVFEDVDPRTLLRLASTQWHANGSLQRQSLGEHDQPLVVFCASDEIARELSAILAETPEASGLTVLGPGQVAEPIARPVAGTATTPTIVPVDVGAWPLGRSTSKNSVNEPPPEEAPQG